MANLQDVALIRHILVEALLTSVTLYSMELYTLLMFFFWGFSDRVSMCSLGWP